MPETSEENGKTPAAVTTPGIPRKGLERREVEKRIYGVERKRLTASVTFLFIDYGIDLNAP